MQTFSNEMFYYLDCYSVYDHNGDGAVSRDEMLQLLRPHVVTLPAGEELEEVAKDLLELAVKRLDEDHDGRVSREDYTAAVTHEPLLLEALGACLPETRVREAREGSLAKDNHEKIAAKDCF